MRKAIGGNRLGSGNKESVDLRTYNRSTHDLSRAFRTTMAPGVLVPFMTEIGLKEDTFDIDLESLIWTAPCTGAIFGSFKFQADLFSIPMRLYNPLLHMNLSGIGMNMSKVYFPYINLPVKNPVLNRNGKMGQYSQSCLASYLGIR